MKKVAQPHVWAPKMVGTEIYGYRVGQTVQISGENKACVFTLRGVKLSQTGEPVEIDVYGGYGNYRSFRTFKIDRLIPPKQPKLTKQQKKELENTKMDNETAVDNTLSAERIAELTAAMDDIPAEIADALNAGEDWEYIAPDVDSIGVTDEQAEAITVSDVPAEIADASPAQRMCRVCSVPLVPTSKRGRPAVACPEHKGAK